jgi:arylsulfatase A
MGMGLPEAQLYDLAADPGEQNNLYESNPETAERLLAQLTEYVNTGSSVQGKDSRNDVDNIKLWKSGN